MTSQLLNPPFLVIEFTHDDSISIVRKEWLKIVDKNYYVYWPPFGKDGRKLQKAIGSGEKPDTKTWTLYPMNIIEKYGKKICFLI